MSDWQKKIDPITLFVQDKDRAKAFYQQVFELEPAYEDENDLMFKLENTLLFLTNSSVASRMIAPAVVGAPDQGPRQVFAIIVADVDAVCTELMARALNCSTVRRIAHGGCERPTSRTQTATSGRSRPSYPARRRPRWRVPGSSTRRSRSRATDASRWLWLRRRHCKSLGRSSSDWTGQEAGCETLLRAGRGLLPKREGAVQPLMAAAVADAARSVGLVAIMWLRKSRISSATWSPALSSRK